MSDSFDGCRNRILSSSDTPFAWESLMNYDRIGTLARARSQDSGTVSLSN